MSGLIDGIKANNFIIVGRAGIDFFTDAGVKVEDAERVTVDLGGSSYLLCQGGFFVYVNLGTAAVKL